MAKNTTYNRTNKNTETPSARKARKQARDNGRGSNSAYTGGARAVRASDDTPEEMRQAWREARGEVNQTRNANGTFGAKPNGRRQVYTSSATGKMSANGKTAGGSTWTMTDKDDDGNTVRQSGRNKIANRSQRQYDVRAGFNQISPNAAKAMLEAGQMSQEEYDNMFSENGTAKYGSLGLSNG